jgi:hypothetical protein
MRASGGDWLNAIYPIQHRIEGKVCEGTWMEVPIGQWTDKPATRTPGESEGG